MSDKIKKSILELQVGEITGSEIYKKISDNIKDTEKKKIIMDMAFEEIIHYEIYKKYTNIDVMPDKKKIFFYNFLSKLFGYTFTIKLLERDEDRNLEMILKPEVIMAIADIDEIRKQEEQHEEELMKMIDEDRVQYISSIILGLNDALVEITGSLAGFTLAMQNTGMVALAGLITGISASLSMAFSQYLAEKSAGKKDYLKSSLYTGVSYFFTVLFLVSPYLFMPKGMNIAALCITLLIATGIIFCFTYYVSVVKDINFRKKFLEMFGISMGVAFFSFIIGITAKNILGVEM